MEAKRIRLVVAGRLYLYEIKKNFSEAAERRGGLYRPPSLSVGMDSI